MTDLSRLDPDGRRALSLAADIVRDCRHRYIGTEHLLAALADTSFDSGRWMNGLHVNQVLILESIRQQYGIGVIPTISQPPMSAFCRKAVEHALKLDSRPVSFRLLEGILIQPECSGAAILETLAHNIDRKLLLGWVAHPDKPQPKELGMEDVRHGFTQHRVSLGETGEAAERDFDRIIGEHDKQLFDLTDGQLDTVLDVFASALESSGDDRAAAKAMLGSIASIKVGP